MGLSAKLTYYALRFSVDKTGWPITIKHVNVIVALINANFSLISLSNNLLKVDFSTEITVLSNDKNILNYCDAIEHHKSPFKAYVDSVYHEYDTFEAWSLMD